MVDLRVDADVVQDQLVDTARDLAAGHSTGPVSPRKPDLLGWLDEWEESLGVVYQHFAGTVEVQVAVSYAAEWMLDNFYIVEQAIDQVRGHLPSSYYAQLPVLASSPLEGYPRVYGMARGIIEYCEGHPDLDRITRFVQAYQDVHALTVGELWALPTMLRISILGWLTHAVVSVADLQIEREDTGALLIGTLPPDVQSEALIANCILSLRLLATHDWREFFEGVSRVEQVLGQDPAGVYRQMDFDTRDWYRGVIEELGQGTGRREEEIAWEAIKLAQEWLEKGERVEPDSEMPREGHVGFYLVDDGRAELEDRLAFRPAWRALVSRWILRNPTLVYLGSIALTAAGALLGVIGYAYNRGGTMAQLIAAGILGTLPEVSVAVGFVNWLVTRIVPPRRLPRLDFQEGIPAKYSTIIVVPALMNDSEEVEALLRQLELVYLGNTDPHLRYALLADLRDAPERHMPGDKDLLKQVKQGVYELNRNYSSAGAEPFYLFYREREWNPSENCWMGWERKRGKLAQFNRLLAGGETLYSVQIGDLDLLPQFKYVITLDADTFLPRGEAHCLVATMAHPLNRAEFDPHSGAVRKGYTVLQPRVAIKPASANRSLFARVFTGDTGIDLYSRAVSDVYQDLFGEGSYAGKGIYDVEAFERSLRNRVPQNSLLSHDLFEGIHGRAALITDSVVYEDYPAHYLAYTTRLHRWVRGDWQLLPWLFGKVPLSDGGTARNRLSLIDRWKILDNLRRSLLTPCLLTLITLGWLWLPGSPLVWTMVGALALAVPALSRVANVIVDGLRGGPWSEGWKAVGTAALRGFFGLVFIPYRALIMVDAILSTLHRLLISHRRLLQWVTAAHSIRLFGLETRVGLLWRRMGTAVMLSIGLGALVVIYRPVSLPVAAPMLLLWVSSPYIAHVIGHTSTHRPVALSAAQRRQLRRLARRTWLYFEQFIGPEDNWLPPDHFQEEPLGLVAHRTSPTNVGLMMLSTLAAHDLGYISSMELILRLRPAFESLGRLEQHRGHLLNWYDTRNLRPLPPRYVSAVDSGNLAGCLLALRQGLQAMPDFPAFRWERWEGLLDTLDVLAESLAGVSDGSEAAGSLLAYLESVRADVLAVNVKPAEWPGLLDHLCRRGLEQFERLLIAFVESVPDGLEMPVVRDLRTWSQRANSQLLNMRQEMSFLLPCLSQMVRPPELFAHPDANPTVVAAWHEFVDALPGIPKLEDAVAFCREARARLGRLQELLNTDVHKTKERTEELAGLVEQAKAWCAELASALLSARFAIESILIGLSDISTLAEEMIAGMDFDFLFDRQRRVYHIGYNVESEKLDGNYYDLLASEARIASLIGIAKGDVPQSHWLHLARPTARVNGSQVLLSWGGSMFEYLMPSLLIHGYEGALLEQSCHAAVARQISFARQRGVPWGISESGYYRFDAGRHYQYRGFGVPGLGFRRGLSQDLVIAPYASLLALSLRPRAVMRNVEHLLQIGMLGHYGFYEAIDYTRSRLPAAQESAIVRSYMVHHNGMALLAMTNYLLDQVMVRRFHSDLRVQGVQILLHEQAPERSTTVVPHPVEMRTVRVVKPPATLEPWHVRLDTPMPQVNVISNGRYGLLVTNTGGGYSSWRGIALTRWRADTTLDEWGTWIYVKDLDSGCLWSAGYQPTRREPENYGISFSSYRAEYDREDDDLSVRAEVIVSPDDDVEIRSITLTNHSARSRRLFLSSYAEVVLSSLADDRRHQAFTKLFVESEWVPELGALLFRRRPRSSEEEPVHMAHTLVLEKPANAQIVFETDRLPFVGRCRTVCSPAAMDGKCAPFSGAIGATLDPIMALGSEVELKQHAKSRIAFLTLAAGSRQELLHLVRRYRAWSRIEWAIDRARSNSRIELGRLGLSTTEIERIQRLLSVLLYPHPALRADPATLACNDRGQPGLWAFGISGDHPILLLRVGDQQELDLARELLQAHAYWRRCLVKVDFVILNERDTSYDQELHGQLYRLLSHVGSDAWLNQRGGIFVLRADQMTESDRTLLFAAARAVLHGRDGPLSRQLQRLRRRLPCLPRFAPIPYDASGVGPTPPVTRPRHLLYDNGFGGFTKDGREYVVFVEPGRHTPAPWLNVMANDEFGCSVSEAGSGFTWAENSGENRITPWSNDPIADASGESLYLRDEETAQIWTPTILPAGAFVPHLVRHGAGYSVYEQNSHGLKQRVRVFVPDAPIKVVQLRLENLWSRPRRITATYYAEWVLGTNRDVNQQYVLQEFDVPNQTLLARNPYSIEFGDRVAFAAASKDLHGLTGDRAEFLGRGGGLARPAALERIGLASAVLPGADPCAALQVHIDLRPHEAEEVTFFLGQAADRSEAVRLVQNYRDADRVETAWEELKDFWDDLLGMIEVHTPDPAMDLLLNRWLLYQTLSCRVWGRSALYQSSGAFGFRDQLQDVMALVHAAPDLTRAHILQAARYQFDAGDVLHWWHPPSGRGVRTRCSDDLLWLPFVTAYYVVTTGDKEILEEKLSFLAGNPLRDDEHERYDLYVAAPGEYTLYEHCRRALKRGNTAGPLGLPLMGSHDWNDGMSRVGVEGRGESVWLAWFLHASLTNFAVICDLMGDQGQAHQYRQQAQDLAQAVETSAWDGEWYRRAYYDDGTPLGSAESDECQIDSIAQSWAVLSCAADAQRAARAMESVAEWLVRFDDSLLLLFTPPFDQTERDPGYVKGYPPGVRENGGQYTHAALWAVRAFAEMGQGDMAGKLFRMLNPIYHSDSPDKAELYRVEPYVVAADVYSEPPHVGRGGWTWYTGSSGWMYQVGLEAILGFRRTGDVLRIDPCIPQNWSSYEIAYRYGETCYRIEVDNSQGVQSGVSLVQLDGRALGDGQIPLVDDGQPHVVQVWMGAKEEMPES